MAIRLLQFTVVIAGTGFSPNTLDPISLAERNIVPQEWNWTIAGNVSTPAVSVINYTNGVSIINERNKFQIADPGVTDDLSQSKAVEIATSYVSKFTQIGYTALGINFHAIVEMSSADSFLKEHFLKSNVLNRPAHPLETLGLRLVYPIAGGNLTINLDGGEAERMLDGKQEKILGLLVVANHHRECKDRPAYKQIIDYLNKAADDWNSLASLVNDIISNENK